jgi:cyclopropane fatty-acyl-phospholipid synthase-like methyltransferase
MVFQGSDFYDDDAIFKTYMAGRQRENNPNDTLEKPVILELAGDLSGQRILDLGCGDAAFGREALTRGCRSYLGIEGSSNMVNSAQQVLDGTTGRVVHATVEDWSYPAQAFDLVISRLVFHYVKDVDAVFRHVYQTLTNPGRFVFSVEHPVITSSDRGWQGKGLRQDWLVDDYFDLGERITSWMGGQVIKYHRTVENYFVGLQRAGFVVESLREAEPQPGRFIEDEETYQRRKRIPLFLILAARKDSL